MLFGITQRESSFPINNHLYRIASEIICFKIFIFIYLLLFFSVQNCFESKCGPHDALSIQEISCVLNSYYGQNVFEGVETRKQLDSYIDCYKGLVKPEKVVFSEKEVTKGTTTTKVPVEWGYYVPFLPSLELLLSNPEVLHDVENPLPHTPGVFRTSLDGGFYRNHPLVKKNPHTLAVEIYSDGAEVTDTASTKSGLHGLTFVYWTLLNLHSERRSSLNAIGLLAVVRTAFLKKHGYGKLLSDFVIAINQLSSSGANLNINNVPRLFNGLLVRSCGDNPGSANLGGYKESAAFSKLPCRQCYVTQDQLYSSFDEADFVLRSKLRHWAEVQEIENYSQSTDGNPQHPSVRYGINSRSVLMDINGFDVTKGLPQDVMHDTVIIHMNSFALDNVQSLSGLLVYSLYLQIEGTLKLDINCILLHVLEKNRMSIGVINQRIRMFSKFVGCNKPRPIDAKHVTKFKLKLTAAQALNLAYILPFVLRKKNTRTGKIESVCDKENLLCYILRLNVMDLLLSEESSTIDVSHYRYVVKVHHTLFLKLYPGKGIPKMHYELHFATHILLFGCARQYWCMR